MTGIYKITNILNNQIYIGLSVDIDKRWARHRSNYIDINNKEYEKTLYRAFRKYGIENFTFEVIEECSKEELANREIYWIAYYDSFSNGYNETPGGEIICSGGE
jgi:group I intron endonuclease